MPKELFEMYWSKAGANMGKVIPPEIREYIKEVAETAFIAGRLSLLDTESPEPPLGLKVVKNVKLTDTHFSKRVEYQIPEVPLYFHKKREPCDPGGVVLPIQYFGGLALQKIGDAWTKNLIEQSKMRRHNSGAVLRIFKSKGLHHA